MQLFDRKPSIADTADTPEVFICVTDPEGAVLPSPDWAEVRVLSTFSDLVTPFSDKVVIIACPDNQAAAQQVKVVVENGAACGVSIVMVDGVTPYAMSALFESSLWQVRHVDFVEWQHEADEAARTAELARRSELTRDEKRLETNARSDGSFKQVDVPVDKGDAEVVESLVL